MVATGHKNGNVVAFWHHGNVLLFGIMACVLFVEGLFSIITGPRYIKMRCYNKYPVTVKVTVTGTTGYIAAIDTHDSGMIIGRL